jgi:hypothetical protein
MTSEQASLSVHQEHQVEDTLHTEEYARQTNTIRGIPSATPQRTSPDAEDHSGNDGQEEETAQNRTHRSPSLKADPVLQSVDASCLVDESGENTDYVKVCAPHINMSNSARFVHV